MSNLTCERGTGENSDDFRAHRWQGLQGSLENRIYSFIIHFQGIMQLEEFRTEKARRLIPETTFYRLNDLIGKFDENSCSIV